MSLRLEQDGFTRRLIFRRVKPDQRRVRFLEEVYNEERLHSALDYRPHESLMKTLKYEEVFRNEYRDLVEAKRSIALSQGFPLCDMLMSMPWSFSKSV